MLFCLLTRLQLAKAVLQSTCGNAGRACACTRMSKIVDAACRPSICWDPLVICLFRRAAMLDWKAEKDAISIIVRDKAISSVHAPKSISHPHYTYSPRSSPRFSPSAAVRQFSMPIRISFPLSSGWEGRGGLVAGLTTCS
jgi:hypothetical protein